MELRKKVLLDPAEAERARVEIAQQQEKEFRTAKGQKGVVNSQQSFLNVKMDPTVRYGKQSDVENKEFS